MDLIDIASRTSYDLRQIMVVSMLAKGLSPHEQIAAMQMASIDIATAAVLSGTNLLESGRKVKFVDEAMRVIITDMLQPAIDKYMELSAYVDEETGDDVTVN